MFNIQQNFTALKQQCESSNRFNSLTSEQLAQYNNELYRAKIAYDAGIDLMQELTQNKDHIKHHYVIPYLLHITDELTDGVIQHKFVVEGESGGIDIDIDIASNFKQHMFDYCKEKYNEENVLHVSTISRNAQAGAIKDVLRVHGASFAESNRLSKLVDGSISWEENKLIIQQREPALFAKFQEPLETIVPYFIGRPRQCIPAYERVNTNQGKIPIHDVSKNHSIAYLNAVGEIAYTENYMKHYSGVKDVYEIELESGKTIHATADHRFFTANGEVKALRDLQIGDELMVIQNPTENEMDGLYYAARN